MNTNDIKVIREATEYIRDYAKSTSPELLSKYAEDAISALDRLEAQQPRVRYRSKVSGMWYETLEAAGDVDCVEVDGVGFCQENGAECLTSQQQPKRLTDEDIERIANYESEFPNHFGDGLRYARDNGYLGGLSVEEVEKVALTWLQLDCGISEAIDKEDMDDLRARLTAKLNGTLS